MKIGVCYEIKGLRPYQQSRPQYQTCGKVELTCYSDTVFTESQSNEEDEVILLQKWNFVRNIKHIQKKEVNSKFDVLGYVANLEEPRNVTTRRGSQTQLQKFELIDETGRVEVTLWGAQTVNNLADGDLIALKTVKVTEFKGKSLSLNGHIEANPQHTRVGEIKQ